MTPEPPDDATGLPGLRRWGQVYAAVVVVFLVWVGLLVALDHVFP